MKDIVLILVIGALTMGATPSTGAGKAPAAKAKCGYTIQRANEAAGHGTPRSNDDKPRMIRAVDTRLAGCPVLVLADGKMMAPPPVADGKAALSPAQ
ncbi:hypothetical protein EDF56_101719 [Novosphingobium sp. PhB165]|uniref:hypothetical protein n=1 Tax=Novosphingobium sp. PhB165 TaxID=2485105 RepID=UPI001046B284|nr:hypothetical protein [Novosphingobium sp. PhB165]TCM22039.1 hypothetical protein EDF56_101719 [Novosphingobium sp. PhB165]